MHKAAARERLRNGRTNVGINGAAVAPMGEGDNVLYAIKRRWHYAH